MMLLGWHSITDDVRRKHFCKLLLLHCLFVPCRVENGKMFEEIYLDKYIAEEREWRNKTEIDSHMGILRDQKTQMILSSRG